MAMPTLQRLESTARRVRCAPAPQGARSTLADTMTRITGGSRWQAQLANQSVAWKTALSPLGITHLDVPFTAERVWEAIHAARAS
jgi:hypothetical protein